MKSISCNVLLAVALPLFTIGCEQPPPTTADEIYHYVRNAAVGADVRKLDPPAQKYVDDVFKAYREFEGRFDPANNLLVPKSLWPTDAKEWRDPEAIEKRLKIIDTYLQGPPQPGTDDAKGIRQTLTKLRDAVAKVPPVADGQQVSMKRLPVVIKEKLEKTASVDGIKPELSEYKQLLELVSENQDAFEPAASGLAFKDAALTDRARQAWNSLNDALQSRRDAEIAHFKSILEPLRQEREDAIKEKRELRGLAERTETQWRRFRELELYIRYLDTRIHDAEKAIADRAKSKAA